MTFFLDDPLLFYPGAAALLLVVVSLLTGLTRLDFLALFRPPVLVRVCLAVLLAFALTAVAVSVQTVGAAAALFLPTAIGGLALAPLYLVALAYGPTVGLVAALLFAPLSSNGAALGWPQLLLGAELTLLGWLAIYPSPRRHRWAGPANAAIARALTVFTGGVVAVRLAGHEVDLLALLNSELARLPGTVVLLLALLAFAPGAYERFFPFSRVAQRVIGSESASDDAVAIGERFMPLGERPARRRALAPIDLDADDPNA